MFIKSHEIPKCLSDQISASTWRYRSPFVEADWEEIDLGYLARAFPHVDRLRPELFDYEMMLQENEAARSKLFADYRGNMSDSYLPGMVSFNEIVDIGGVDEDSPLSLYFRSGEPPCLIYLADIGDFTYWHFAEISVETFVKVVTTNQS